MTVENRRFVRSGCQLQASYRCVSRNGFEPRLGRFAAVRDISQGGLRIRIQEFVALSETMILSLNLPNRRPYEVRIKPEWINELPQYGNYEVGVSFVDAAEEVKSAIRTYQMQCLTS